MCAIAALISKKYTVSAKQMNDMDRAMAHRGPDAVGTYISEHKRIGLGSDRLSLVDLTASGNQPMTKFNRTIVFNGEIYNFREINAELRSLGHTFTSQSDTETILTAFEVWGIAGIHKFNGAFSFILHDRDTDDIYIVRDRIGEKPLYYTETNEYFMVASEIKAFLTMPSVRLEPDIDTIQSNFIFHFFADKESSYFKHIKSLAPGQYIKIHNGTMQFITYWDVQMTLDSKEEQNIPAYIDKFHSLLTDATKIRLEADAEVGSIFSGGIDSSLITAIASKLAGHPLKCFTLNIKNYIDEDLKHARQLYEEIHNLKHIPVDINSDIFSVENLDTVSKHLEEVVLNRISLYVNANYKTVHRHHLKAVLNGQGSDEISLGYYTYYDFMHYKPEMLSFQDFSKYWYRQFALKIYMKKQDCMRLIEQNLIKNFLPYKTRDVLNQALAFGIKTHLLNILNHEDRFSMKESVECRTVFTDYRLIEMFMAIPSKIKVDDGREKYLVRKLGERLLPKDIATRFKMGFPDLPDGHQKLVHQILSDKNFKKSELINTVFSPKIFDKIDKLPDPLQWKIASLYRFEKVFFN